MRTKISKVERMILKKSFSYFKRQTKNVAILALDTKKNIFDSQTSYINYN